MNIQSVIKFPQIPQKIVIIYHDTIHDPIEGQMLITNQMTIHVLTFTTSAKIYLALMGIMKSTEAEKERLAVE